MIERHLKQTMHSVAAAVFSLLLATSMLPLSAFAQPSIEIVPAASQTGTFDGGKGQWSFAEGTLVIKPASGQSECTMKDSMWRGTVSQNSITNVLIEGNVYIDDSAVTAFQGMSEVTNMNLGNLNTSKLTTMAGMFKGVKKLRNLDVTKFNTQGVTDMRSMFEDCEMLLSVDVSRFITVKVTNMNSMFMNCRSLNDLDLSIFNTAKVTDMSYMFKNCTELVNLNISAFNNTTPRSTNPDVYASSTEMLLSCDKLRMIKVGENFSFMDKISAEQNSLPAGRWFSAFKGAAISDVEATSQRRDSQGNSYADSFFKTPVNIKYVKILPVTGTFMYDGTLKQPEPGVTLDNGIHFLKSGEHFSYQYTGNKINAGDYQITIEGMNDFEGNSAKEGIYTTFTIKRASIIGAKVDAIPAQACTGKELKPAVTVTLKNGQKLDSSDYWVVYGNNIQPGTATVTVYGQGNYDSTTSITGTFQITGTMPEDATEKITVYRLYNPNSGEHLFTIDENERKTLVPLGWKDEGVAWVAPTEKLSSKPVYRFYNPNSGDHHYSMDAKERDTLIFNGWKYEGVKWYSDETQTVPIYRLFNPNAKVGTHHYTTDKNEYETLGRIGWRKEDIGWYGLRS